MEIIRLKRKIIYRADNDKKVKFLNDNKLYSEIVVSKERNDIIEVEVEYGEL